MSYEAAALGPQGYGTYRVEWLGPEPTFEKVNRPPELILIPGFVDIHFHGAFGIDMMSATSADWTVLLKRLEAEGYEALLPTTVTAAASDVTSAIDNLPLDPMIVGFHLEGPFISNAYPGAQPASHIADIPLGESEWDQVLDHPLLRMVTLAPEIPHGLDLIGKLRSTGVRVSMGHSNATYDEARRGYEFGAAHVTHMYNAMRPFHHREPGLLGYSLICDDLDAELIYDRHHVSKEAARLLFKCKGIGRVIGISDCSMACGMPPGTKIDMWGHACVVERGKVTLEGSGTLAGSALCLSDVFRRLWEDFGPETAIQCCCFNPRRALDMNESPRVYLELDKDLQIIGRRVRARS